VARAAEQLTLVLIPENRQRSGVQESDAPFRIDHVKRVRDGRDRGKQRARIGKFPRVASGAHGHSRTSAVVGEGRVAALTEA
jgi:hypothetical protein